MSDMSLSRTKQGLDQLSQGAGRAPRVKGTSRDNDIRAETSLPNTQSEKVPGLSPPQDKSSEQGGPCPVLPGPAMSSRLLCCVALCLLGPGMSLAQLDVSVPMLREPESFFSSIRVRALFFLQLLSPSITGPVDSGVTQTPRHLVKPRGQTVTLTCSPISGHTAVSWYQQAHGQSPQFLVQYYRSEEQQRGNMSDRFSGKQLGDYSSELTASSLELQDSALYLCASSSAQPQRVTWVLCTNLPGPARSYLTADRPGRTWGPQGNAGGLGTGRTALGFLGQQRTRAPVHLLYQHAHSNLTFLAWHSGALRQREDRCRPTLFLGREFIGGSKLLVTCVVWQIEALEFVLQIQRKKYRFWRKSRK